MVKKLEYCPKCDTPLVPIDMVRVRCPNGGCSFVDRRQGPSYIDPDADRRGSINRHEIARAKARGEDPWADYKRYK